MKHFAAFQEASIVQEAEVATAATELSAQLLLQRKARKGFAKTIAGFEQHLQTLRKTVERADRNFRRVSAKAVLADPEATLQRRHFKRLHAPQRMLMRPGQAVAQIRKGKERPFYPMTISRHDHRASQMRVIDEGFRSLHWGTAPRLQSEAAMELGCFPDIPMLASRFVAHVHVAYRILLAQKKGFDTRFLDIGCGGGNTLLLAAELFGHADGLDYDQGYVDLATQVFANCAARRCHAFRANGLTFDGHGDYDVIYFYQPMSDAAGLIAPYAKFGARAHDLDCRRIEDSVYVAGISEAEADALRREALRTGTDIFPPERALNVQQIAWLKDLWMACAANGYMPD